MTKIEETTMSNGTQYNEMNNQKAKQGHSTWKAVTIGGLTGIFFGAASSFGTNIYTAVKRSEAAEAEKAQKAKEDIESSDAVQESVEKHTTQKATPKAKSTEESDEVKEQSTKETPEAKVTDEGKEPEVQEPKPDENDGTNQGKVTGPDDEKSFADAFQEARDAKGPGNLFVWDGKICTTYTEEEWNNLTEHEREEFAMNAHTYTVDDTIDDVLPDPKIEEQTIVNNPTVDLASTKPSETSDDIDNYAHNSSSNATVQVDDVDVQIVGTGTMTMPDGQDVDVAHVRLNDEDVAIIDVDQDGEPDIAMADFNHNGTPDEGEILDLHTNEVISGSNYAQTEQTIPETDPNAPIEAEFEPDVDDATIVDDTEGYFSV